MAGHSAPQGDERLREQVRDFAEIEVLPRISEMETSRIAHHELSRLIARQGWIGAMVPLRYGGMGLGPVAKTIIIEELSRASAAMGAMVQASILGTAKIVLFGDEAQRRTWLPAVAAGQVMPTIAVTETGSGSHVLGMQATAVPRRGGYILNGRKVFVGNSAIGDLHGVVVRTGHGSSGLSAFLVESSRPGCELGPAREAMGLHGFSFGELILDDCWVPAANLIGAEGDGLAVAYSSSVLYGRPNLAAVSLGIHEALVAETISYAVGQHRYGEPLADLPTVKAKLGMMHSRLMSARLALYDAVAKLDAGQPCDADLFHAKLVNAESAVDSARTAMEVHGACGLFSDRPIERYLRDAFHILAPAGTSEVQILRLAEHALGREKTRGKQQWSQRFPRGLGPIEPDTSEPDTREPAAAADTDALSPPQARYPDRVLR
jgi:alkylation response protein AidB-like acyl-CoA dehydrogenase